MTTLMDLFEAVLTEGQKNAVTEYVLGDGAKPLGGLLPPGEPPTSKQRDVMAAVIQTALLELQDEETR